MTSADTVVISFRIPASLDRLFRVFLASKGLTIADWGNRHVLTAVITDPWLKTAMPQEVEALITANAPPPEPTEEEKIELEIQERRKQIDAEISIIEEGIRERHQKLGIAYVDPRKKVGSRAKDSGGGRG